MQDPIKLKKIYGWIQLSKLALINFGLIQFSTTPGMKPLSCPSQFILIVTTKGSQEQFPGKRAIP